MTAPATIGDLTVSTPANSYGMVLLQFTAPSSYGTGGASTININHSVAAAESWVDSLTNMGIRDPAGQTMPGTGTSCRFMVTDLTPDTNYDFRIRATNQNSEAGTWSGTATVPAGNGFLANALPQARGAGAQSGGARSGVYDPNDITIIKVTSTNEDGAGTLQEAAETTGPRIIKFDLAGRSDLDTSKIQIDKPYCTILGQTTFENGGGGFIVSGQPLYARSHHIIISHMNFILGDHATDWDDEEDGATGALMLNDQVVTEDDVVYQLIFFRCLAAWGADENLDIFLETDMTPGNLPAYDSTRCTIQQCIITDCFDTEPISPGPGADSKNGALRRNENTSMLFNIFGPAEDRSPRLNSNPLVEVIGNGYAFASSCDMGTPNPKRSTLLNFFSNNAKFLNDNFMMVIGPPGGPYDDDHEIYVGDKDAAQGSTANLGGQRTSDTEDEWDNISTPSGADGYQVGTIHPLLGVPVGPSETDISRPPSRAEAEAIYLSLAGPFVLNDVAQFAIDVYNGAEAGRILLTEPGPYPVPQTFTGDVDTNNDGIPNSFEVANGFAIETMSPVGYDLSSIYTNIEMWAFGLVNEEPPAEDVPVSLTVTTTVTVITTKTTTVKI